MKRWFEYTKPRLENVAKKWKEINISNASNQTLLDGITEMGIEEGNYWSDDSSHTFGVAKSTDDQFNTFLKTVLPDHNFTSGQFLSGIDSKALQANADLFEIKLIRGNDELEYLVLTVPAPFLMEALQKNEKAKRLIVHLIICSVFMVIKVTALTLSNPLRKRIHPVYLHH